MAWLKPCPSERSSRRWRECAASPWGDRIGDRCGFALGRSYRRSLQLRLGGIGSAITATSPWRDQVGDRCSFCLGEIRSAIAAASPWRDQVGDRCGFALERSGRRSLRLLPWRDQIGDRCDFCDLGPFWNWFGNAFRLSEFSEGHGFSHAITLPLEGTALAAEGMLPIKRVHNFGTYFVTANCASKRSIFQVERNAGLFFQVLQHNRQHYKLHAFVIMPDHFHLLLTPGALALERCLHLVKGGFSRRYHLELSGLRDVWQKGFADHRVRDRADYDKHLRYIEENPVAAGLVSSAEEYPWSSASRVLRERKSLSG